MYSISVRRVNRSARLLRLGKFGRVGVCERKNEHDVFVVLVSPLPVLCALLFCCPLSKHFVFSCKTFFRFFSDEFCLFVQAGWSFSHAQ